MTHIDFSRDILKHYVRRKGWLPAAQGQKRAIRRRSKRIPLRYFTFCAAEAIDVFMLERDGILSRNEKTGRLEGVWFCEEDEEAFGKIADLIGSPEQGFLGQFEKIVLFKDDDDTREQNLYPEDDDPYYPPPIRRKLQLKDANHRLQGAFPFDIINLDVRGVMFPPRKGVINKLVSSLIRVLEWQTTSKLPINNQLCKRFTLFLTSHIDPDITDEDAIQQLINRLAENTKTNPEFRTAFGDQYGHCDASRLADENFPEFFCLALPKFIIHRALFQVGWGVTHGPVYLYNRDDLFHEGRQYQIMHSISVYERIPNFGQRLDEPGTRQYARTVAQVVNDGIKWVDEITQQPKVQRELEQDLAEVVAFRDQYREQ